MKKKILFSVLALLVSVSGFCATRYAIGSASAPTGTLSYCAGTLNDGTYSDNYFHCGSCTSCTGGVSVHWKWQLDGTDLTGTGTSGTFTASASDGNVTLPANIFSVSAGTHTLRVVYSWTGTPTGCTGTSITTGNLTITGNSLPTVTATPSSATYCYQATATNLVASGASTYNWLPDDGSLDAITGASVNSSPLTNTTYTVTGTNTTTGCSSYTTVSVTAADQFQAITIPSVTVCSSSPSSLGTSITNSQYNTVAVATYSLLTGSSTTITDFFDVDGVSTNLDDGIASVPLPFTFYFYGSGFSSVNVCTNGFIDFMDPLNTDWNSHVLPDLYAPSGLIALFMEDLNLNNGGTISYLTTGTAPYRSFAITYDAVGDNFSPTSTNSGQIVLHETTNAIDLQISSCNPEAIVTVTTTTGLQNFDGSIGIAPSLPYATNGVYYTITTGTAWHFSGVQSTSGYSYSWTPSASLDNATIYSPTASPTTATIYTVTATDATSGCTATAYDTVGTYSLPPAISGASSMCKSPYTTTLSDAYSGGTWSASGDASVAGLTSTTAVVTGGASSGSATITYTDANSCHTTLTIAVTSSATQSWLGGTSGATTDWGTAGNWACGTVPIATDDVVIGSNTYIPDISATSGNGVAHTLTINSGDTLIIDHGYSMTTQGNFTNNGNVRGTGQLSLQGSSAISIYGSGVVYNLELNNSAGATLAESLNIAGTLTLTSGTLYADTFLTILSNSVDTGRVGIITGGALSGSISDQQFTGDSNRSHLWGHPFIEDISLMQFMSGNQMTVYGPELDPSNFCFTTIHSNSANYTYWYNTDANAWQAFGQICPWIATDTQLFQQFEGIEIHLWRDKSPVIKTIGSLNQRDFAIRLKKGTSSDYNTISNPYLSPINLGAVVRHAFASGQLSSKYFYVWCTYQATGGLFNTISSDTDYYIQPNTSYQVRAAHNGDTIQFHETDKVNHYTKILLKQEQEAPTTLSLQIYDLKNNPWDKVDIRFNDAATEDEDKNLDAGKTQNPHDMNFYSWTTDHKKLSIDERPLVVGHTVRFGLYSDYNQTFIMRVNNMPETATTIYLHDKWLHRFVRLNKGAEYRFDITDNPASEGDNRFEVSLGIDDETSLAATSAITFELQPNPAAKEAKMVYNIGGGEAQVKVMDMLGVTVYETDLGSQMSGSTTLDLSEFAAGVYLVELTAGNKKLIRRLTKD